MLFSGVLRVSGLNGIEGRADVLESRTNQVLQSSTVPFVHLINIVRCRCAYSGPQMALLDDLGFENLMALLGKAARRRFQTFAACTRVSEADHHSKQMRDDGTYP